MVQDDKMLFIKIKNVKTAMADYIQKVITNSMKNYHFYSGKFSSVKYHGSYSYDALKDNQARINQKMKELGADKVSRYDPQTKEISMKLSTFDKNSPHFLRDMKEIMKCIKTKNTHITESICQMCSGNNEDFISETNQFKVGKSTCNAVVGDCSWYWHMIFRDSIAQAYFSNKTKKDYI